MILSNLLIDPTNDLSHSNVKDVDREARKKKCSAACSTVMRNLLSALSDLSFFLFMFSFAEFGPCSWSLRAFRAACYVTLKIITKKHFRTRPKLAIWLADCATKKALIQKQMRVSGWKITLAWKRCCFLLIYWVGSLHKSLFLLKLGIIN